VPLGPPEIADFYWNSREPHLQHESEECSVYFFLKEQSFLDPAQAQGFEHEERADGNTTTKVQCKRLHQES
jgi:hypothetical protein